MKPRTRLEKLVAGLSEKLPAITKAQEEWAKEHVFDHVAYKCKNELWCSECGEIWVNTGNSKLGDNIECPYCHYQLDVKVSRKQKNHEEGVYVHPASERRVSGNPAYTMLEKRP